MRRALRKAPFLEAGELPWTLTLFSGENSFAPHSLWLLARPFGMFFPVNDLSVSEGSTGRGWGGVSPLEVTWESTSCWGTFGSPGVILHLGKSRLMISLAIESFQTLHGLPVYSPPVSSPSQRHTQSSFPDIILKPDLLLSFFASIIHHSPSPPNSLSLPPSLPLMVATLKSSETIWRKDTHLIWFLSKG